MQGRVKCPSCETSTIPVEGRCEFCGAVVNRAAVDASVARRASGESIANDLPRTRRRPSFWVMVVGLVVGLTAAGAQLLAIHLQQKRLEEEHRYIMDRAAELDRDAAKLGIVIETGAKGSASSLRSDLHWLVPDRALRARRDELLAKIDEAIAAGTVDASALASAATEAGRVSKDHLVDGDEAERVFKLIEAAL